MKWLGLGLVALVMLLLAGLYVGSIAPAVRRDRLSACVELKPTPFSPTLGRLPRAAPDVSLEDINGKSLSLSAYRGRVVVLNFWAPWCPPCMEEMPSMDGLSRRTASEPISIVAVGTGTSWQEIREKLAELLPAGTTMTLLLDPEGTPGQAGGASHRFGTEKLPETYLIDRQGNVRYYFVNKREWNDPRAQRCLEALAEE